jgi:tRNA threonylcarbamoyladenosine biosynthesis protein TsaB
MTARILAFDTATEHLSIALQAGGEVFVHEAEGGAKASATLIPSIFVLLGRAGLGLAELDAIAFGRGPGAFTGLRTACSVAQGLAFGAGKPVLPIDTLLALAEDARAGVRRPTRLWATLDARMDEIYAAHFGFADGRWSVLAAPMLTRPDDLDARWRDDPPEHVAGNALVAFGERLQTGAAQRSPDARPRAAAMLPLAQAAWAAGGGVDAALALPLYLRDKVAQTTLEREAARALKVVGAERAASGDRAHDGEHSRSVTP